MTTKEREILIGEIAAASILGLSPYTLRSWRQRNSGKLDFYKLGKSIRYREDDVMELLKRSKVSQLEKTKTEGL